MGGPVTKKRRGPLRLAWTVLANTFCILFLDSFGSWRRDFRYFGPALASICLVLIATGVVGVLVFSGFELLQAQTRDVSRLTVYLKDSDPSAVDGLVSLLRSDPRVQSVTYVSKAQALAAAQQRPELAQLANFADSNPFPANLVVQVNYLQDVGAIDAMVRQDPNVDQQIPTSYDAGTYQRVQLVLRVLLIGGAALLLVGGIVAIGLTSTSIRGVVSARRDELSVMKLIGTPSWMIRGPFLVEGAVSGIVGGLLAGLSVAGLCLIATDKGKVYANWLPGVTSETAFIAFALLVIAGFGLGSVSSLVELRKVR